MTLLSPHIHKKHSEDRQTCTLLSFQIKGCKPPMRYRPEKRTVFRRTDSSTEPSSISKMAEKVHANLAKKSAIGWQCSSSLQSRSELSVMRKHATNASGDSKENIFATCSISRPYASSANEDTRNDMATEFVIATKSEGLIVQVNSRTD